MTVHDKFIFQMAALVWLRIRKQIEGQTSVLSGILALIAHRVRGRIVINFERDGLLNLAIFEPHLLIP